MSGREIRNGALKLELCMVEKKNPESFVNGQTLTFDLQYCAQDSNM